MTKVEPEIVQYEYKFKNETVLLSVDTSTTQPETDDEPPNWTRLSHHQCECCPLKLDEHSHCPAALKTNKLLDAFHNAESVERVHVTVVTSRRTYNENCDLQTGINSLLGLLMATSGCPVLGKLRSLATFHTPFCSFGETLYRTVGAYLTKQYFEKTDGGTPDWELHGLKELYDELGGLNKDFSLRIREAVSNDAIANAVVIFFSTSSVVSMSLHECLEEFKDYFTGIGDRPPEGW
jgi:hypothetical protein